MDMEDNRPLSLRRDVLKCHACHGHLQPPIYTCDVVHVMCGACRDDHATFCTVPVTHSEILDIVANAATMPCRYESFGCVARILYHEDADHRRTCPRAPCGCPEAERGCRFFGSRKELLAHVADSCDGHARTIISFRYEQPHVRFNLALSEPWCILVGEDEAAAANGAERHGDLFLVSLGERRGTTFVSVVSVRADGVAPGVPQFSCALTVEDPVDSSRLTIQLPQMTSSSLSGDAPAAAPGEVKGLPVGEYLSDDVVALILEIKKLEPDPSPPHDAADITPPAQDAAGKNKKRKSTPKKFAPKVV